MTLDPQVQAFMKRAAESGAPQAHEMSPEDARAHFEKAYGSNVTRDACLSVDDRTIPTRAGEVVVRRYELNEASSSGAIVFFHGGGYVMGSINTHDGLCAELALRSGVMVFSVDYRLSPECQYPGPIEDCIDATLWVMDHAPEFGLDTNRIAVGGDSAGGNLAASVCYDFQVNKRKPIAFQLLMYPKMSHVFTDEELASEGVGHSAKSSKHFTDLYLGGADPADPLASPIFAEDYSGLPSTFAAVAEYDPLCGDAETYVARMQEAGVDSTVTRYPGMIHGFVQLFQFLDVGSQALDDCAERLRNAVG